MEEKEVLSGNRNLVRNGREEGKMTILLLDVSITLLSLQELHRRDRFDYEDNKIQGKENP